MKTPRATPSTGTRLARSARAGASSAGVLLGLLATLALLLTALWWFSGTRTFQGLITDYLLAQTDVEWSVERTRVAWPCDLVCNGMVMRGVQGGSQGTVVIGTARIGWRGRRALEVELLAPSVELVRQDDDKWQPRFLAPLGGLDDVADVASMFRGLRPGLCLLVRDGQVTWIDGDTRETIASVDGLNFTSRPMTLPELPMRYYLLVARSVQRANGARGQAIRREWISTPVSDYVELDFKGTWLDDADTADFWTRNGRPPQGVKGVAP